MPTGKTRLPLGAAGTENVRCTDPVLPSRLTTPLADAASTVAPTSGGGCANSPPGFTVGRPRVLAIQSTAAPVGVTV